MLSGCLRKLGSARKNARALMDMVRIVEVGPRDGLQNVKNCLPTSLKLELINHLKCTGLRSIEVGSFVSPERVPQMADTAEVVNTITKDSGEMEYSVLVPNVRGVERAISLNVKEVLVITAATESFTRSNINCSIEDSLRNCMAIRKICMERQVRTRAMISCVAGCPYEGDVNPCQVVNLAEALLNIGCYEVGLGDTIGVATPTKMANLLSELRKMTGGDVWRFAVHCHDTYGQALANIYECLRQGIRVFDSSVAGLGGCPFAPGSSGNVSTEDLVYLLEGQGMRTGVDLTKIVAAGEFISKALCVPNQSKVAKACLSKCAKD